MTCPEHLRTQSLLDGQLGEKDAREAERHIETCAECRQTRAETEALGHYIRHDSRVIPRRVCSPRELERCWTQRIANRLAETEFTSVVSGLVRPGARVFPRWRPVCRVLPDTSAIGRHADRSRHGRPCECARKRTHHRGSFQQSSHRQAMVCRPRAGVTARDGFRAGRFHARRRARGDDRRIAGRVVVYRHGAHEIDLFVWASSGTTLPASGLRHGYHSVFWRNGDLRFCRRFRHGTVRARQIVGLVKSERE